MSFLFEKQFRYSLNNLILVIAIMIVTIETEPSVLTKRTVIMAVNRISSNVIILTAFLLFGDVMDTKIVVTAAMKLKTVKQEHVLKIGFDAIIRDNVFL